MRSVRSLLLALAALAAVLLPAASAAALSYPVTSTGDDAVKGTLRGSIGEANAHTGPDSIPIEVSGTITLGSALPPIGDVTITGPGPASLTIVRDESAPPFSVLESGGSATVSGITIRGGLNYVGAGILNGSTSDLTLIRVVVTDNEARGLVSGFAVLASGGGIFSNGSLTLRESVVSGNRAISTGGEQTLAAGGGIETEGTLFVERSTISDNVVEALGDGEAGADAIGGGIAIANLAGATIIEESTISGNSVLAADATDVAAARGGGIGGVGGTVSLTGSTIAANSVQLDAAGVLTSHVAGDNVDAGVVARNSLIALPAGEGKSCANGLVSGGFNLDEDDSCGLTKSSDLAGVTPGIDPVLKDNGGPTPTHALLEGSIAIDRGNSFGAAVDQRGLLRPSDFPSISNKEGGDGSDIGAFELQVPPDAVALPAAPILVGTEPSDRTPPRTRIVSGPARVGFERLARFRFASNEAQSTFQCRVDRKPYRKCRSPYKLKVAPGKHHFRVRAIDRFGNVDRTAARFSWQVKPLS
jgi:hypothetical protein